MTENPNNITSKYSVNFGDDYKDRIAEQVVDKWVLRWVEKYHPETFIEARKEVYNRLDLEIPTRHKEKKSKKT